MSFDTSLVGRPGAPSKLAYAWKDVVLYALGVGAKIDELDYLYEARGPKTYEQAVLYRLSGDLNPLHLDPDFAKMAGFAQGPILHGLCTFGHMVRHVVRGACNGDATRLRSIEGQFRKPVWPGDTISTEG